MTDRLDQWEIDQARRQADAEARRDEQAKGRRQMAERHAGPALRAAIGSRLPDANIDTLVGSLDLTRFLTDAGDVDTEKVSAYAARLTGQTPPEPRRRFPDTGGGRRGPAPSSQRGADLERGADRYRQRRGQGSTRQ